jgi:hypothetical protein
MDRSKCPTHRSLRFCRAIAAGLVCLFAAWSGQGQDAPGILKLSIVDESTRQTIPARVEVLDQDGKAYLAEDGLLIGGD